MDKTRVQPPRRASTAIAYNEDDDTGRGTKRRASGSRPPSKRRKQEPELKLVEILDAGIFNETGTKDYFFVCLWENGDTTYKQLGTFPRGLKNPAIVAYFRENPLQAAQCHLDVAFDLKVAVEFGDPGKVRKSPNHTKYKWVSEQFDSGEDRLCTDWRAADFDDEHQTSSLLSRIRQLTPIFFDPENYAEVSHDWSVPSSSNQRALIDNEDFGENIFFQEEFSSSPIAHETSAPSASATIVARNLESDAVFEDHVLLENSSPVVSNQLPKPTASLEKASSSMKLGNSKSSSKRMQPDANAPSTSILTEECASESSQSPSNSNALDSNAEEFVSSSNSDAKHDLRRKKKLNKRRKKKEPCGTPAVSSSLIRLHSPISPIDWSSEESKRLLEAWGFGPYKSNPEENRRSDRESSPITPAGGQSEHNQRIDSDVFTTQPNEYVTVHATHEENL